MDRIDAQEARAAVGLGLLAQPDVDLDGPGLGEGDDAPAVGLGRPEVVEMGDRDILEALVPGVAKEPVGSLKQLLGRRTGKTFVQVVGVDQELDVLGGIPAWKTIARSGLGDDPAFDSVHGDEAGNLGIGEAGHAQHVVFDNSLILSC